MTFDQTVDWLGESEQVLNLGMFFEGLWMWFWMNRNRAVESNPRIKCSPQVLQKFCDIKTKRKWNVFYADWLKFQRCSNEAERFFDIVKDYKGLCSQRYDMDKWIWALCGQRFFKNITDIFAEETEIVFYIDNHPAVGNCPKPGRCGFIIKTTPAKDGANIILCTDPSDYSGEIHYHDEFQAKDMHLVAAVSDPYYFYQYLPLSWNGIPVIRNGDVYWGELLSECTGYGVCYFYLRVQLHCRSD
jgi:hypothetical protein